VLNIPLILFGKLISKIFKELNLGNGSTWPGHIALAARKNFIKEILGSNPNLKIIIIAGTNGKTTTALLIKESLKKNGKRVFQNKSGANLLNGIASTLILHSSMYGKLDYDHAIFEIDENNLSLILDQITPDYLVLLNLFRDQLDRYGEVNIVATHWKGGIRNLTNKTTLILNADDPQISYLAKDTKANKLFFGLSSSSDNNGGLQHAADSNYCPNCSEKLDYEYVTFSHLGNWYCSNCSLRRPKLDIEDFSIYPLPGTYNKYNTHAATLLLKNVGISENNIKNSFKDFKPAFGRQETVRYKGKSIQIFLSKNPTSFNQSYQAMLDLGGENLLVVLNDRIPDGRDISWIWDVDLPSINKFGRILVSGDRAYDMALRLKYELGVASYESRVRVFSDLKKAIDTGVSLIKENETLFVLPTYSAMLETRKIITGKKIL
jgi:lipid II isoglutaminyl synthase (glutamine-hydrolysing)